MLQMHCWCCCITYTYIIYTLCTVEVVCVDMYVYHSTCTSDVYHTSSKRCIVLPSMCSTFSLLDVEWKLRVHATNDVQTLKLTQRYSILACCWCHWYEFCWFVIFQLFFLKICWTFKNRSTFAIFELAKIFRNCSFLMLKSTKAHYKCIAGAVVYNVCTAVTRFVPWESFV